eukprot:scaffold14356_cov194-Skeletonema_marinoi.AAC.16
MAELREELLFKQPETSHLGDCPICFLPLSLDENKSSLSSCCCVLICGGCACANQVSNEPLCPFCREPYAASRAEADRNLLKRIEAGDRVAFRQKGCQGKEEHNYSVAVEYLTKAANMDDVEAHNQLSQLYYNGEGVERDMKKAVHHLEEAAIGGHPRARFNLGVVSTRDGRLTKAELAAALRAHQAAVDSTKSPQREAAAHATVAF